MIPNAYYSFFSWFRIAIDLLHYTHHNCHYLDYFQSEFADNGTETCFMIEDKQAVIRAVTSGKRREGIIYSLFLGDVQIPDATEDTEFNNSSG